MTCYMKLLFMNAQIINSIEIEDMCILNEIINKYTVNCSFDQFQNTKNVIYRELNEIIKEVEFYKKDTGIMLGTIKIGQDNILYSLIFDNQVVIFEKVKLPLFHDFFEKNKKQTQFFFMNHQIAKEYQEVLQIDLSNSIELKTDSNKSNSTNSTDSLKTIMKETVNCIIQKSQIRTINRTDKQKSLEFLFNKDDIIKISCFTNSVSLYFNFVDQYLYVVKNFNENNTNFAHETDFYERVGNECPFISKFFAKIQTKSQQSIMTEYIEGQTLYDFIMKNKNKLTFYDKIKMILEIMISIEYIHSKNIILRDLKWDNIMINSKRRVVLIDFDRTKIIETDQQSLSDENITGDINSPYFQSPEQYSSNDYSFKSDIYSLGMIIQFILSETRFNYDTFNLFKIMMKEEKNILDLDLEVIPTYDLEEEALYDVFKECLEYFPEDRPNISHIINSILFAFVNLDSDSQLYSF